MGENGAVKFDPDEVLGGIYHPDEGRIYIAGSARTVIKAAARGHGQRRDVIHQELSLAEELSVAENIYRGEFPRKSLGRVDWADPSTPDRRDPFESSGFGFNARTRCGRDLRSRNQQMVQNRPRLTVLADRP